MAKKLLDSKGNPIRKDGKDLFISDTVEIVKGVDPEKRLLTITGTTEGKDRDGDIIKLKGWDLNNYKKNPVFLWGHDYRSVPLGSAVKVVKKYKPSRIDFTIKFPTEGLNPFADMILALYNEKIINASSVGFLPTKWERLEDKDDTGSGAVAMGRKFIKQELLELSGVPVPSNPEALQLSIKSFAEDKDFTPFFMLKDLYVPEALDDIMEELSCKSIEEEIEGELIFQVPEDLDSKDLDEDADETKGDAPEEEISGDDIDESLIKLELDGEVIKELKEDELGDEISKSDLEKPFPNEHSCRLTDPAKYDKFRRSNCFAKVDKKCVDYIFGIKGDKSEVQALRFNKDVWTKEDAKKYCKEKKGSFEASSNSSKNNCSQCVEDEIKVDEIKSLNEIIEEKSQEILDLNKQIKDLNEELESKAGATLSKKNKDRLEKASDLIVKVLEEANPPEENTNDDKSFSQTQDDHVSANEDSEGHDLYKEILKPDEVVEPQKDEDSKDMKDLLKHLRELITVLKK